MAVAALQRVTDQTNKAQDRAHSLEMALQTAQVQSSQWRERYEEERIKCTQMRKSLVQNIDNINLLQSQLEGVIGQEATLKSQLLQHQHTEAELHLNISLLEHNLHTCRTQDTWRQQQEDTKKQQEIVKGRQQDSIGLVYYTPTRRKKQLDCVTVVVGKGVSTSILTMIFIGL
nr:TRAF3-interacting JNK-activating modulator-like [Salvelinus alpinus]